MLNAYADVNRTAATRPPAGLPPTSPRNRDVAMRNRQLGATQGNAPITPVLGAPSAHLVSGRDGTVHTEIVRNIVHLENLTDSELRPFWNVARKMEHSAVSMSQGPLKQPVLDKMGNPYGHGKRRGLGRLQGGKTGVSNMSILNKQSGEVAASWYSDVRRSKGQVITVLGNSSDHSVFTAKGTSRMKAHGPYAAAVVLHIHELNSVARRLGALGQRREAMMQQMGGFYAWNP